MRKGPATGPQAPQEEPRRAPPADLDSRRRNSYDDALRRMGMEADRIRDALYQMPAGSTFQPAADVPLSPVLGMEAQLTKLRVQFEQLIHGVVEE